MDTRALNPNGRNAFVVIAVAVTVGIGCGGYLIALVLALVLRSGGHTP